MSNIYDEMAAQQFTGTEIESMVSPLTYFFAGLVAASAAARGLKNFGLTIREIDQDWKRSVTGNTKVGGKSMSNEVTVQIMPKRLTAGDLDAVKNDPLSAVSDIDEMHKRIGWLICAYDAIVESRLNTRID